MEPLTGYPHVSRLLVKRYLSFIKKAESSKKHSVRDCKEICQVNHRIESEKNYDIVWETKY